MNELDSLEELLARAKAEVAAMTPQQYADMIEAQQQSFLRSMEPCEHGMRDWEDCGKCREAAK